MESVRWHDERQVDRALAFAGACFMGESGVFHIYGADAIEFLHRVSTNALSDLKPGDSRDTIFTNEKGRIIEVATLKRMIDGVLLLISAERKTELVRWIEKLIVADDVQMDDISSDFATSLLIGPQSISIMNSLLPSSVVGSYLASIEVGGRQVLAVSGNAANTEVVRFLLPREHAADAWEGLAQRLSEAGAVVVERQVMETLRIAAGIPRAKYEIREDFNPYDVGLRHLVSYTKGCYVGQEVIARLDTYEKVRKGPLGLRVPESAQMQEVPLPLFRDGTEVGECTSLSPLPFSGVRVGYVVARLDRVGPGDVVAIGSPSADASSTLFSFPMRGTFS